MQSNCGKNQAVGSLEKTTLFARRECRAQDGEMNFFCLVFSCLLTAILTHSMMTLNLAGGFLWAALHPDALLMTWAFLMSLTSLLQSLTGSLRRGVAIGQGFFFLIAIISVCKRRQFGAPLYPWDFELSDETWSILPSAIKSNPQTLMMIPLVLVGWLLLVRLLPHANFVRWKSRIATGLVAGLFLSVTLLANNPWHDVLFKSHFKFNQQHPMDSIEANGLLIGFIMMKEMGELFPPTNFTLESARQIYDRYLPLPPTGSATRTPAALNGERPDVIAIMSESLFDPQELKSLKWNKDPLAYTRSLAGNHPLSLSVVPTFGYRTANSEFEFLTGFSMHFFAKGTIPFMAFPESQRESIVRSFDAAGYRTVAMHPGIRDFYNRDQVYPRLGFQHYYSEESFIDAQKYGEQISDESILPLLKKSLGESDQPSFHFIVTIQNHHPYNVNPFDLTNLDFDTTGVGKDEQVVLNHYSKLLEATDRFHQDLIEYLRSRSRPTVVLLFGDHLPSLLPGFEFYKRGMVHSESWRDWTPQEWKAMFTTPLMIWSNFGNFQETQPLEVSYLGVRLIEKLGLPLTAFQKFVATASRDVPIVNPHMLPDPKKSEKDKISDYKIIQYGTFTHQLPEVWDNQIGSL